MVVAVLSIILRRILGLGPGSVGGVSWKISSMFQRHFKHWMSYIYPELTVFTLQMKNKVQRKDTIYWSQAALKSQR